MPKQAQVTDFSAMRRRTAVRDLFPEEVQEYLDSAARIYRADLDVDDRVSSALYRR